MTSEPFDLLARLAPCPACNGEGSTWLMSYGPDLDEYEVPCDRCVDGLVLTCPTAVPVGWFEVASPAWHAARLDGLGGSEIAAVLGLSPWETRFSLYHRKTGLLDSADENPEMEWGRRLEPVIADKYAENHPEHDVVPTGTWRHIDRPWQLANPDRLVGTDRVLEIKVARTSDGWGEPGTDDIPVYYRAQVLWYLDTLGILEGDVAVLIGGTDYREYRLTYDAAEAEFLRSAAQEFLDQVHRGEAPPIDGSETTYRVIQRMNPKIDGTDVDIDEALARRFCTARFLLADAEQAEQAARSEIALAMGNAKRARWAGFTIATRQARGDGDPYVVAGRKLPSFEIPPTERNTAA